MLIHLLTACPLEWRLQPIKPYGERIPEAQNLLRCKELLLLAVSENRAATSHLSTSLSRVIIFPLTLPAQWVSGFRLTQPASMQTQVLTVVGLSQVAHSLPMASAG